MIVTCPDCDTSFQLDESRIPQKGIRVRCSRCKHAFHLPHPSASQSEAIDAVAAEAAAGGGTSAPPVTRDLPDPGTSAGASDPRDEINNEDDAEWEFNQDIPPTEEEPADDDGELFGDGMDQGGESGLDLGSDAPDSLDLAGDEPDSSGLDLAAEPVAPAAGPEAAQSAAPAAPASSDAGSPVAHEATPEPPAGSGQKLGATAASPEADGSDFGSVDDFSSLMDDDPLDTAGAPQADDTADELRAQAADQAGQYALEGQDDDLGDPEKWDFFDDAASQAAPPSGAVLGRIALQPAGASATDHLADDWTPARPVADITEKGRVAQLLESAGRSVGWTIVIVGFGLGLVSGLWVTAESFVAGERVTPVGPLEAVDMRAEWVETARAGRLLVVSGGLRNPTRRETTIPGTVEIALLDRLGQRLARPAVSAGVQLSERQLRELPAEVLTSVRSQAARELRTASIPAGGLLPFQALIFDAPPSGLRFEAQLAESGELSLPTPRVEDPAETADTGVAAQDQPRTGSDTGVELGSEDAVGATAGEAIEEAPGAAGVEEAAEADAAPAPVPSEPSAAQPGYEDPYGDDSGMGLQDL